MNNSKMRYAVAAALVATLALAGCKKKDEPVPPPVVVEPAPTPPVTPAPLPAATVSVTSVDLGNAVGSDMRVTAPSTSFGKNDTIIAAVSTSTSDALSSVPGTLSAKWSFQDGQVVNEENKAVTFTGNGVTDFQISKPDGWPAGNYKVEISLDGTVVQSRDFSVK